MESESEKYDNVLLSVLQNEGKIQPFLDAVFNFLYRRTDFYRIMHSNTEKIGFYPGTAEKITLQAFKKYQMLAALDEQDRLKVLADLENQDDVEHVEVESNSAVESSAGRREPGDGASAEVETKRTVKSRPTQESCYNGATHGNYSFSQTLVDLDVHIKVPSHVTKAKSVRVDLRPDHLRAEYLSESGTWEVAVDGDLVHPVDMRESMWTLVPGEGINVNFVKRSERWWDCLLTGEPKLDVSTLDVTQPIEELQDDERAKIGELMFDQKQKMLGQPTIQQLKVQNILKEAWNKEGSPFQGQPFDPSVVNICGSMDSMGGLG